MLCRKPRKADLLLPRVNKRSQGAVHEVSALRGPCRSLMLGKVKCQGVYVHEVNKAQKLFFLSHSVSSVGRERTAVLHLLLSWFCCFRCSSLAPRGKGSGTGKAGTWTCRDHLRVEKKWDLWKWRRGEKGKDSSCRC